MKPETWNLKLNFMRLYIFLLLVLTFSACNPENVNKSTNAGTSRANSNNAVTNTGPVPVDTYEVVKSYKHDPDAFTQGLVIHNGFFYESDGEYGESNVRKVEIETGRILQKQNIPDEYFAEGLTILNDKIYQLTWRENTAFQYDMNLKLIKEFRYMGFEGWGLTNDGTNLIMSDGTHVIRIINPENFETIRTIVVKDEQGRRITKLNELEYVKGEIWANIWHSEEIGKPNHIARISPQDGKLLGWVDLQGISPDDVKRDTENVLNGIAYDAAADRLFVTGKNWKSVFEIKVKPKP